MYACYIGNIEIVKTLLDNNADTKAFDSMDRNALVHAVIAGNIDVAEFLLINGMSLDSPDGFITLLMWAVIYDNLKSVKYLIEKGADIEITDINGWNSFMFACAKGYIDIVKYILGLYPNIVDNKSKSGETALMIAADNGRDEIVRYLLENNASVKEKNLNGHSALYISYSKGYFEICEQLIKYYEINGLDKNLLEKEYNTAKENGFGSISDLFNNKLKS